MSRVQHYDIFQKLPSKDPTCVETAASLEDARDRMKELMQMFPADYFIFDWENSRIVIPCQCQGSERRE
jgi:hypothetical protein